MKKTIALFCLFVPLLLAAQGDSILSGVYHWKEGAKINTSSSVLFEGSTYSMDWMQMSANAISPSKIKVTPAIVPANEEHLMIIKSGNLTITIKDSTYVIGAGSIALLMPGEMFSIQSRDIEPCNYYLIKYRSRQSVDKAKEDAGKSMVIDWNKVAFKQHDKGGRRDFFERATAMGKRLEMHVTTLKAGLKSHDPHTHKAPEMVLVTEGNAEMQIGDKMYKGHTGSVYFLGSGVLHALQNTGNDNCTYFAFQFE